MRNLIIFIRRYFHFFLFLVLEIICLSLVVNNNGYQRATWLSSANAVSGYLFGKVNSVTKYFDLTATNDSLSKQNARLLNQLSSSFTKPDTATGVQVDSNGQRQYRYFPAKVVNNSVSHLLNYITIHRGRKQGIRPGMGVIGPSGIVGIVREVTDDYAVVLSLLNKDTRISALLPRSGNFGSVIWDIHPPDPRFGSLVDIPKSIPVHKGDTVVTSGYSAIFPRGLPIGYVDEISLSKTSKFYQIDIRFATDFRSLQYVYVIENLNAAEQRSVEEKGQHE